MIKVVEKVTYNDLLNSGRFDSKYYYMGETINKTLSNFKTILLSTLTKSIRKGIFDLNSRYYQNEGIPFIRISNLKSYTIDEKGLVYIPIENHRMELKTKLEPGDLALSKVGKYLGKISQIPLRYKEVNTSQNIIAVRFKCEDYLKKYTFLYLTTPLAINQILRVSKEHNQSKLTLPDIRNLKIPLLSEDKMKKYAKEVDNLSYLEDKSYKLIKKAQAYFYEKLDIDFNLIKKEFCFESSLSQIKEESFFTPQYSNPLYRNTIRAFNKFKTVKLKEVCSIYKGTEVGSDNYNLYVDKIDSDIPFIRTSDIVNYEVDSYPDFYISEDIYNEIKLKVEPFDILFTKDGSIGNLAMTTNNDKVIVSSGFSILRVKKNMKISPYYIFCALSIPEISEYQAIMRTVIASTIPHLNEKNVLKIEIPILEEQDQLIIIELIKEAFDLKAQRKHKLDSIKNSLRLEFEDYL